MPAEVSLDGCHVEAHRWHLAEKGEEAQAIG